MSDFSFMSVVELLRADGSIIINKKLNFSLGTHTTMIYTELLSRFMYFLEKDKLTKDGYFFNTVNDLKLGTGLSKTAQTNAINQLEELGFIKKDLRGIPPKRHFKIIPDSQLIEEYLIKGAEKIQELKKKQAENADMAKISYSKRFKEYATSYLNSTSQTCNNNNLNNNNFNNIKKKRDRKQVSNPSSFTFKQALKKLQPELDEIEDNVSYYLKKYKKIIGEKHSQLKLNQWEKVFNSITVILDERFNNREYELFGDDFKSVVDQHFKTKYKNCDYNILHFISGQVMLNRVYEVAY